MFKLEGRLVCVLGGEEGVVEERRGVKRDRRREGTVLMCFLYLSPDVVRGFSDVYVPMFLCLSSGSFAWVPSSYVWFPSSSG